VKAVFPYPVLTGDISLTVDRVLVDDVARRWDQVSDQDRVIALHEVKSDWNEIRIKVSVTADGAELADGAWNSPACVAVVRNGRTKIRHTFRCGRTVPEDGPGTSSCDAVSMWVGARSTHGSWPRSGRIRPPRRHGTGCLACRLRGQGSHPATLHQDGLEDFTDEGNPELNEFREDPWLLDGQADEPVLY